jgi:hypothetical protein
MSTRNHNQRHIPFLPLRCILERTGRRTVLFGEVGFEICQR